MGKIGELLSDEESVKQLSEIAKMFMSDSDSDEPSDSSDENLSDNEETDDSERDEGGFDFGSLMKLTGLMGAFSQTDKNSELLLALKPHLKEDKQKKVDKAVKLLKLIAVWNIAKESGLLNDIL